MNIVWQQHVGRQYHVTEEHCATDFLSVSCWSQFTFQHVRILCFYFCDPMSTPYV